MLSKYFKPGQKLQVHPHPGATAAEHLESLTGQVVQCAADNLELCLVYPFKTGEEFPLQRGMAVEIVSQSFGLGVRARSEVTEIGAGNLIRVRCQGQLEAFQRRTLPRIELPLGLRYARGATSLRVLKDKWRKNLHLLHESGNSPQRPRFSTCAVNLSGGGIRFDFPEQVEVAELCMLLLELTPDSPPVCALAEVMWTRPAEKSGWKTAGMQFTHIRKSDQQRICRFVTQAQQQARQAAPENPS